MCRLCRLPTTVPLTWYVLMIMSTVQYQVASTTKPQHSSFPRAMSHAEQDSILTKQAYPSGRLHEPNMSQFRREISVLRKPQARSPAILIRGDKLPGTCTRRSLLLSEIIESTSFLERTYIYTKRSPPSVKHKIVDS